MSDLAYKLEKKAFTEASWIMVHVLHPDPTEEISGLQLQRSWIKGQEILEQILDIYGHELPEGLRAEMSPVFNDI